MTASVLMESSPHSDLALEDEILAHCTNSGGRIRLNATREYLDGVLDSREDLTILTKVYDAWREEIDYMVLRHNYRKSLTTKFSQEAKVFAVKCAKRGNDVYVKLRIEKKLHGLYEIGSLADKSEVHASFLTLTCDPKPYGGSRTLAWEDVGKKWNRLVTWIRKNNSCFIGFFRVFEVTDKGYPHLHVLLFWSHPKYIDKERLDALWGAFSWISKVKNLEGSINYLIKYLTKSFSNPKHLLTPSVLWLLKKRSFGVSRSLFDLIHHMRNSNSRQKTLDGKNDETENFNFLGIFSQQNLQEIGELHQSEVPIMGWYVVLDFDPEGAMI